MRFTHAIASSVLALGLTFVGGCDDKKGDEKKDVKAADAKKADEKKADVKADDAKMADAKAVDPAAPKNIVETAVAAGTFTTLATALGKAGLVETLSGTEEFTVFAPNDEAFAKVPKEALDALLADPEGLKKVLLMHVVKGKVMAADAAKLTEAEMMSGDKLVIDATDGVKIGDAKVITADVAASNGVIHIIDTVILPKG